MIAELVNAYGERLLIPVVILEMLGDMPEGWFGKSVIRL